jgi:hypothetical protein
MLTFLLTHAELGIDLGGILVKTRSVLLHRLNNRVLDDLDMGGALVFVFVLAGLHLLVGLDPTDQGGSTLSWARHPTIQRR